MPSVVSYYRSRKLVVIGADFFSQGGAWRSIYLYLRDQEAKGQPVHLLDLRGPRSFRQFSATAFFAPRILVNGLGPFAFLSVLLLCLLRRDVIVYLHDTEYYLYNFQKVMPLRHRLLRTILRRNSILCVSKQAEELYRDRYGATRTYVVYECPGEEQLPSFETGKIHIVMVGSIDERKGVELFSRVADLASKHCPDWQFHWVGGVASRSNLYRSDAVKWHGWQWQPRDFIRQADLFFLSSIDDPCPLGALEALQLGKRCVAYRKTGTAELIEGIGGCALYSEYSDESAFAALQKALRESADKLKIARMLQANISLTSFTDRMAVVLQAAGEVRRTNGSTTPNSIS